MPLEQESLNLIKKLTEAQGISGQESRIRAILEEEMRPFVDEIEVSPLGNIFGIKKSQVPNAPRLMVAAHMDEVGFIVKYIQDNGLIKVVPIGGWNVYGVSAQRYTLQTAKGDYPIISSMVAPHLLRGKEQSQLKPEQIVFDAGFVSKEEALEFGVRPGAAIVPEVTTVLTANKKGIISKAWDNRYGCVVIIEVLKRLKNIQLPFDLIIGATVQEEVGLRGVKGAVHHYDPDVFIAVDCSPAGDTEPNGDKQGILGDGFLLRIQDPGMITHRGLIDYIQGIAEEWYINYQPFFSAGGTDAGAAHTMNDGVPSAVIGVPARYIHGHQALYHIEDYKSARKMLYQAIINFDEQALQNILDK